MSIFYEPVNLNHWYMFDRVSGPGHIEPFLATKAMKTGDLVLLHVGRQHHSHESGVYAYGTVVTEPYILRNSPGDYCNDKLTVDVRIDHIQHNVPMITHEDFKGFVTNFRRVCRIKDCYYANLLERLGL